MRANGAERLDYGFYLEKYHCGICDDTQAGAGASVGLSDENARIDLNNTHKH